MTATVTAVAPAADVPYFVIRASGNLALETIRHEPPLEAAAVLVPSEAATVVKAPGIATSRRLTAEKKVRVFLDRKSSSQRRNLPTLETGIRGLRTVFRM